jgi:aminoglycoside phosphotransferase (APT) family kinase protein
MADEPRVAELIRLGGGREADVFAWDEHLALRLARDPGRAEKIKREATALAGAHEAGAPVPAVHGLVSVEGRPGALLDRVHGEDLLTLIGRRPWLVRSVGRSCGAIHARLHELRAPAELPSLREELVSSLRSPLVPANIRRAALAALERLPDDERLCHGDFHPANVLDASGNRVVIDWTRAARGDPAADVARTRLLIKDAAVADDAPLLVRRPDRVGRLLLFAAYLRGYRSQRALNAELVNRWQLVCTAARLAENVEGERASLLRELRGWDSNPQPLG